VATAQVCEVVYKLLQELIMVETFLKTTILLFSLAELPLSAIGLHISAADFPAAVRSLTLNVTNILRFRDHPAPQDAVTLK
jgi:hypothetical protein